MATTLLPKESLFLGLGAGRAWAGPLGRGEMNAAKGAHLCFALHGDRQERGNKDGSGCVRGGGPRERQPPQGQPLRAGTLLVSGKRGGKLPTDQMQENWIPQPFTLLLGPL